MRFKDKTVLITGAVGGFGVGMAHSFAAEGARLVLADLSAEKLATMAAGLSEKGCQVAVLAGDVTDPDHHAALVNLAIQSFGTLDVAVNNAGIVNSMQALPDIPVKDAKAVIDIDVMGVFYAMQAQLPVMEKTFRETGQGTAMVNIASVAGLIGCAYLSIYSAAKHAVVGLTKGAAAEYARRGIRVNAICPAFSATAMIEKYYTETDKERAAATSSLTRGMPMGRVGSVDEIVQAILFAAAPENSFMTGETIAVDGGLSAV